MTKMLEVKRLQFSTDRPDLDEVSDRLDSLDERTRIDVLNWKNFSYKPEVSFSIAYTGNEILLKYYVKENWFKAEKTETNQMVCEDSCVEFFVSPADDGIYYNIEFNGIGTCLLGTGTSRADGKKADPAIVSRIRRKTSFGNKPLAEKEGNHSWTVTTAIPLDVFFRHKITALNGKSFRANFYKCGDKLTVPHYLTWNRVDTENPDYHRPEYFGILKFI